MGTRLGPVGRACTTVSALALVLVGCTAGPGTEEAATTDAPIPRDTAATTAADSATPMSNVSFVGGVAGLTTLVGIHIVGSAEDPGDVHVLVVDGHPGGTAEWFEGTAEAGTLQLTSASGNARLEGEISVSGGHGTLTFRDGSSRVFATRPAGHGAGIYGIAVDSAGAWEGESFDGDTLMARQQGDRVVGELVTAAGDRYPR